MKLINFYFPHKPTPPQVSIMYWYNAKTCFPARMKYEHLLSHYMEPLIKLMSHPRQQVALLAADLLSMSKMADTLNVEWTCRLCHVVMAHFLAAMKIEGKSLYNIF